ncbi:MAG: hypothetical protein FWC28_08285 [Proteobacteria bacterium]|nr:hypothetical protein [Cystobacterineae bacterium]MCL2258437.1 hypothetical protein [Cystobacterineae bacterium]MCL2315230.1 hypothetical protein [Pseudomonadota bacterium]
MKTLIVFVVLLSKTAFAQQYDSAPIPFEDEAPVLPSSRHQGRGTVEADNFAKHVDYKDTRSKKLASKDEPALGLSFDIHGGAIWLNESKVGHTARLSLGARITWEWSRTFLDDEYWRKVFFVDLTWNITRAKEGSELVYTQVMHNYLVLAPAWSLPLAQGAFAFFVQGGIGVFFLNSTLTLGELETTNKGIFLLGQYGLGCRARIPLDREKAFALVLRADMTGYIHRHLHDIVFAIGLGVGF